MLTAAIRKSEILNLAGCLSITMAFIHLKVMLKHFEEECGCGQAPP